jgi:hypothetical protein
MKEERRPWAAGMMNCEPRYALPDREGTDYWLAFHVVESAAAAGVIWLGMRRTGL